MLSPNHGEDVAIDERQIIGGSAVGSTEGEPSSSGAKPGHSSLDYLFRVALEKRC